MGPWLPTRELGDEHATHDRARLSVLGVAQVGYLAAQQDSVIGVDRQPPDAIARLARRPLHDRPELVVVADRSAGCVADRDRRRAGEGRKVDHVRRAVAQGMCERIGKHQAALGIRVDDLDGLAVGADDHVTGTLSRGAGHVLGGGDDGHHVQGKLARGDDVDGRQHRRGTRHIVFHPAHVFRVFERDAAGVEGDPLSDEGEHRAVASGRVVVAVMPHADHAWRLR